MKYVNYMLVGTLIIVALGQMGCLSGNALNNANKLEEAKDYRGALEAYQVIVDENPGSEDARKAQLAIGKLNIEHMNQPARGIQVYNAIITEAPESEDAAEAHYRIGMYNYDKIKNYDEAVNQFDTIVNQFPHLDISHRAQLMLAVSYEKAQEYEQAVEVFENFANRNPQTKRAAQALANKARIQREHLKDETEAKRTLQFMVKKYGKNDDAQSHIEKAKEELIELNAEIPKPENPEDTQIGRAMLRQQERRERDRPRDVERSPVVKNKAVMADSGFGVSAEQVMSSFGGNTAIASDDQGTYYDAELMIAKFFYDDENYRDAGALYFDAIARAEAEKAKLNPHTYLRLSICYRKLGMHKKAAEVLKKASSRDSKVIDAVISTGQNQYTNEEYEKALETFNSVAGLNRNKDSEVYWFIGKTYQKLGEHEKERDAFERAVANNPEDTDALQSLAEVLHYRLNDRKTAIIFQDLVEQKRDSFITLKTLGDVCYKHGQYNKAQIKYKAASRIAERMMNKSESDTDKQILTYQFGLGKVLAVISMFKYGREADAQTLLDEFANDHPDHTLIPYAKAEIALFKGDEETAVAAFKEAIEKNPDTDIAVLALGDYYLSKGYNDEAVSLWETYLESNKSNVRVLRRLNSLNENSDE